MLDIIPNEAGIKLMDDENHDIVGYIEFSHTDNGIICVAGLCHIGGTFRGPAMMVDLFAWAKSYGFEFSAYDKGLVRGYLGRMYQTARADLS